MRHFFLAMIGTALFGATGPTFAWQLGGWPSLVDLVPGTNAPMSAKLTQRELLAKAEPDECFTGVGDMPLPIGSDGQCKDSQPKVNAAYVWGLAEYVDDAHKSKYYFGTGPNINCLVLGGFLGQASAIETDSYVCEGGDSFLVPPLPSALGDFRVSQLYVYSDEGGLMDLTEQVKSDEVGRAILARTIGIRTFGVTEKGLAIAGGPTFPTSPDAPAGVFSAGGVGFFAFNAATMDFLGAWEAEDLTNVRRFLRDEKGGGTYVGVGAEGGVGWVLKWTGDLNDPFSYEVVGEVPGEVANLSMYGRRGDRIVITTWPQLGSGSLELTGRAAVFVSPKFYGSLETDARDDWKEAWSINDYDPNPAVAAVMGGGDGRQRHRLLQRRLDLLGNDGGSRPAAFCANSGASGRGR